LGWRRILFAGMCSDSNCFGTLDDWIAREGELQKRRKSLMMLCKRGMAFLWVDPA
jgi:hypothetical protein